MTSWRVISNKQNRNKRYQKCAIGCNLTKKVFKTRIARFTSLAITATIIIVELIIIYHNFLLPSRTVIHALMVRFRTYTHTSPIARYHALCSVVGPLSSLPKPHHKICLTHTQQVISYSGAGGRSQESTV